MIPHGPAYEYMRLAHPMIVYTTGAGKRLLAKEFWQQGIRRNIPQHYKEFYEKWRIGPQIHIHSKPTQTKFEKDEWGEIFPVQNPRIHVLYPEEFHEGLWGGEGVIKGRKANEETKHKSYKIPPAKYWWPKLFEGVVYSEVLDAHVEMIMTMRGARLVDEVEGFDNYILKTPVNEVYAWRLLRLKREILLALSNKENFTATNHKLGSKVYDKYHKYAVTEEEADWTGLTLLEAEDKQSWIEEKAYKASLIPDKLRYRQELIELLNSGNLDDIDLELLEEDNDDRSEKKGVAGVFSGIKNAFGRK